MAGNGGRGAPSEEGAPRGAPKGVVWGHGWRVPCVAGGLGRPSRGPRPPRPGEEAVWSPRQVLITPFCDHTDDCYAGDGFGGCHSHLTSLCEIYTVGRTRRSKPKEQL